MYHVLTKQVLGRKYSCWILILQEFDLEFSKAKDKKSLVFMKLMCDFHHADTTLEHINYLPDESLFFINTIDPWYGDLFLYLQTQRFYPNLSHDEHHHIHHHAKRYLILGDTLYHRGIDSILR